MSNISHVTSHAQLIRRNVIENIWVFFLRWGWDRSKLPPCCKTLIFQVKRILQSTAHTVSVRALSRLWRRVSWQDERLNLTWSPNHEHMTPTRTSQPIGGRQCQNGKYPGQEIYHTGKHNTLDHRLRRWPTLNRTLDQPYARWHAIHQIKYIIRNLALKTCRLKFFCYWVYHHIKLFINDS